MLGFFTENGNHTDNSAIFIGILSDIPNIAAIQFELTAASSHPEDFAIGPVALNTHVPEPATLALLGAGLATLGMVRRRKTV